MKQSVGMIGGKPNQAYYFYGYAGKCLRQLCSSKSRPKIKIFLIKDDDLLYMDPHEVQPFVNNIIEDMNDSSYHTNTMWKLKFSYLDPSVALVQNIFISVKNFRIKINK